MRHPLRTLLATLALAATAPLSAQGGAAGPAFDVTGVPFSRAGSYLALSARPERGFPDSPEAEAEARVEPEGRPQLRLWSVAGWDDDDAVADVDLVRDGVVLPTAYGATPGVLTATADGARAQACFETPRVLRLRATGAGLRLTVREEDALGARPALAATPGTDRHARVFQGFYNRLALTALRGALDVGRAGGATTYEVRPDDDGVAEAALEVYLSAWSPRDYPAPFEACPPEVEAEYRAFLDGTPAVPPAYEGGRRLAAYVNWASLVEPRGLLTRPSMLMSKNWMHWVWSWDHAFNALALALGGQADLAWDQWMVPFDFQDPETGAIPDRMNDHSLILGYVKPPVHGLILREMMGTGVLTPERTRTAYDVLSRWTRFWTEYRDADGNGLPEYHHGNDSGWDNGTFFDVGVPLEGADLAAFLVVQMDVLADLADRLDRPREAADWRARSDEMLGRMLGRFWTGERFVSKVPGTETYTAEARSLMGYLPLVLGDRLPPDVREALVDDLRAPNSLLTPYGPATEHPESPLYVPDGYWRGAIWAPTTWLTVYGLEASGAVDLADETARRFVENATERGFGENFDPLTGASLRDPAYTWTTSVYLTLAHRLLGDEDPTRGE